MKRPRMHFCSIFLLASIFCISTRTLLPQTPPNDSNKIQFFVSVWSKGEGFGQRINAEDLAVFAGKTQLEGPYIVTNTRPTTIGILVDLSGSVVRSKAKLSDTVTGLKTLLRWDKGYEYFLLGFDEEARVLIDKTRELKTIEFGVENMRSLRPKEKGALTAFYDSLAWGINQFRNTSSRRVLIIVSDGLDNASKTSNYGTAMNSAKSQDIALYFIDILERPTGRSPEAGSSSPERDRLKRLAEVSGGRYLNCRGAESCEEIFASLGSEINGQYLVEVRTDMLTKAGKWHELTLKLSKDSALRERGVKLRTKAGFHF